MEAQRLGKPPDVGQRRTTAVAGAGRGGVQLQRFVVRVDRVVRALLHAKDVPKRCVPDGDVCGGLGASQNGDSASLALAFPNVVRAILN